MTTKTGWLTTLTISLLLLLFSCGAKDASHSIHGGVPNYLAQHADQYAQDPRAANLAWFKDAQYGLFIHYGLYALMGEGEWVQLKHDPPVPVAEYAKLADQFKAENFDADEITDFVINAGMKYITITSKHHDGYSLFDTAQSDFKSMNSPCGRDLIGELARGLRQKRSWPVSVLQPGS